MFKSQNFCHIASNNRNQVKAGVFVYRTTDDLATVSASGYFNDRIIDINLHDIIIHEKVNATDNTKVEQNILCVTERTLSNIGTTVVKSKWEGEVDTALNQIQQIVDALPNTYVKIDGSSIITGPLKMRSSVSFKCAIAPSWDGVGFYKLNDNDSLTLLASMETTDGFTPAKNNTYNIGTSSRKWKDAYIARVITGVVNNGYDIAVPVTNSADTLALKSEVDLAANSGRMITDQGVWYAKMYAATVAPSAENGTNYADFSQTDGQGNPIIVIYERQSGAWVQSETITPPAEYDGYVPITSKIWDIAEQTGQQGGRVLWNHQSKDFTPYPQIISFENAALTGVPTAPLPTNASPNNQIATKEYVDNATANSGYHPDLFDWKWADHQLNDMQWLRADTFSWQSSSVYQEAYDHLADEYDDLPTQSVDYVMIQNENRKFYRDPLNDVDTQTYSHPYAFTSYMDDVITTIYSSWNHKVGGADYYATPSGTVYGYCPAGSEGVDDLPTRSFETISGTTIAYYTADDGHKIVLPNQESNVAAIYTATGSAWYYILDKANTRFKLPRSKHNKYADTVPVIGVGKALGLTDGTQELGLSYYANNSYYTAAAKNNSGQTVGSTFDGTGTTLSNKILGVSTDATKSGMVAQQTQDTDEYKYLYFYVGSFTQTALENTAGLNAELFNGKADLNLANVLANIDFVVESQLPTASNNYTWYRKYRSGWVEQGGQQTGNKTVNLLVEMADTNYETIINTLYDASGSAPYNELGYVSKTTTSFTKSGNANDFNWVVYGMAA